MNANRTIDCTGFFCPMPIAKAKIALDAMATGEVLEIVADDPGFEKDLPAWCQATGNVFRGMEKDNGVFRGYVQKK
jgi:TusA-related sulfurtransferase